MPATSPENENNQSTTRRPVVIIRTGTSMTVSSLPPPWGHAQSNCAAPWSGATPSQSPDAFLASRLLYSLSAPECCEQKGTIQDVEARCYLILTRPQWGLGTTCPCVVYVLYGVQAIRNERIWTRTCHVKLQDRELIGNGDSVTPCDLFPERLRARILDSHAKHIRVTVTYGVIFLGSHISNSSEVYSYRRFWMVAVDAPADVGTH
jgi:hypothetical protein